MIKKLKIENFKSIKNLSIDCKKINVILGEPNSGKSNLLEALSLFGLKNHDDSLKSIVRYDDLLNLFLDNDISNRIHCSADGYSFDFSVQDNKGKLNLYNKKKLILDHEFGLDGEVNRSSTSNGVNTLNIKRYKFNSNTDISYGHSDTVLRPPNGNNLAYTIFNNKFLKQEISDLIKDLGYRLIIKPVERKLEILKEKDDIIYSFPYNTISDTIQRIIFYLSAIETNEKSIILLEEPEANTFPFYTTQLAESITLDDSNQYFIITHNPYFLQTLIEKTPTNQLMVNIAYMKNYETKIRQLNSEKEVSEMIDLDSSIFFNFNKFI